ncbi:PAS domain-containing sensor histidine kinase [Anaerobacillus alkaliphilus]|uniref:histidine kinase n=1 Tax=Anaerobacillus alkaliphilus TaxID=1548597 RepID=A0A4Q0VNP2_9BACI|nr:PAS domain-containing sensor histidine kinase [Anaerobacillus alkaliphilus]RXI96714.1 PAS domain-containing sensor histidine kinase [Anaerobacillus alkaliphilus]
METRNSLNSFATDIKYALDATTIIGITDQHGKIIYVNDKFCTISKYEREELLGQDHRILNSGYHPKQFFVDMYRTIRSGVVWTGEIRNKAKDGSYYWVHTTIVPFLDDQGKPYQYISIRIDITDRKATEENLKNTLKALASSNKELADIKHALDASSILAITDEKGIITYVNDTFCEISKYNRDELIGQDHRLLNSSHHPKTFFKEMWKKIGAGQIWKGEIKNLTKEGKEYWVDTTIVPFLNEKGKPYQYVAIRKDITDRKKVEEMILRSEKLALIGELAAGVAHEIRNPLTSLRGYTEFLKDETSEEEKQQYFDILLDEIERIDFIVSEFMLLAKPKVLKFNSKNINAVLTQTITFLKTEAKFKKVSIHTDLELDELIVQCDENQLKQVFLNLIKNAIEAMPNGGELTIRSKRKDNYVVIEFQDQGVGIPKEKLEKLGEPFFSTKESGNGLGLMVCFKIVADHKGTVKVESEVNVGTKFIIELPLSKS